MANREYPVWNTRKNKRKYRREAKCKKLYYANYYVGPDLNDTS